MPAKQNDGDFYRQERRMRLAEFIVHNIEPILTEWEAFARRIWPPAAREGMVTDPAELRDHAEDILRATARDMAAAQTETERAEKSRGGRDGGGGGGGAESRRLNLASEEHGSGRVESGFKLNELVSEYRALRASVIRLWRQSTPDPDRHDIDDLTRFNESIDQSLNTAVSSYTQRIDRSRQLFLAILGHDLRNPLGAMTMSAKLLGLRGQSDAEASKTATRIIASADAMARMISDLLDFTGAGLGGGMRIDIAPMDLREVCRAVVDEIRAANPDCTIRVESDGGSARGHWDAARLRQLVSNLLGNAVQHGAETCRVKLTVNGADPNAVVLAVHNKGPPIPRAMLATIFDPLVRVAEPEVQLRRRAGSIGLGLFIAREVATAHGGEIGVTSSAKAGTVFTVRLPRRRGRARAASKASGVQRKPQRS